MAGIKIVDLPALGRDLISTDLLELSLAGGTGSRKITGQEIMNASKLSVGNTPIINGAVGQVLFQGTGNVLQESANLFWDNTNGRLGIGTSTPLFNLDVVGTSRLQSSVVSMATFSTTATAGRIIINNTTATPNAGFGLSANNVLKWSLASYGTTSDFTFFNDALGSDALFIKGSTNNVLINTTTDAGYKLLVNGTSNFKNTVNIDTVITGGSYLFRVISQGPGVELFSILENQVMNLNCANTYLRSNGAMYSQGSSGMNFYANNWYPQGDTRIGWNFGGNALAATGADSILSLVRINPSIGNFTTGTTNQGNSLLISPTINQVNTGTHIVRGIYYNPTLTSTTGVTHRALELTSGDFVWGAGYSQYYGNSVEGFIQFNISGTTTQMWMRPPNNPNNYGASYYSKISHTNADLTINSGQYGNLYLGANGGSGANASMVLFNASANTLCNVLIGTTTNAGYRLDVNGTARVQGLITGTAGITISGGNSNVYGLTFNSGGIGATGQGLFTDGKTNIQNSQGPRTNGGAAYLFTAYAGGNYDSIQLVNNGTTNAMLLQGGYSSSNQPQFNVNLFHVNNTLNFTTGTTTVKGIYYNPTLTSMTGVTAHWAFHSTSGRVRFEGLPTSPTGLNAGDIYNDGGTLKIV